MRVRMPQMMRCLPVAFGVCVSLAGGAEVTILDWNILMYNDPGSDEYDALVRIVEAVDPDIILFEEAHGASGRAAFMSRFSSRYPYGFLGSPAYENPRNQIHSAYPLSNTAEIFTSDPNGGLFVRPTVRADVDVLPLEAGTELRVYAAHYKAGEESRDRTLRLNQATSDSADIVALVTTDPNARVYYAGDLNAEVGDAPLNKLIEPQTTLSRLTIVDPNTLDDMTRWPSGRTIDHIFYSAALANRFLDHYIFYTETFAPAEVPPPALSGDSETASDHLALVAVIEIPENGSTEGVLINEAYVDQEGTADTQEFIELAGPPGESLDGLAVVIIEGDDTKTGQVDRVWSLSGRTIPADGYFVLGDAALAPDFGIGSQNTLEDGTQTILLVSGVTVSPGQDVDADNDGVAELSVGASIVDSLALVDGGISSADRTYYGAPVIGPHASGGVAPGGARCPDGQDTNAAGDWVALRYDLDGRDGGGVSSPGEANHPVEGNLDGDCDVDVDDVVLFEAALSGADVAASDPRTDFDGDGDADLADFGILQVRLTGPR